jgi:hypothetical protein
MRNVFQFCAVMALLAASAAFACEPCKTGYTEVNGKCEPNPTPTPTPVSNNSSSTSNSASNSASTSKSNSSATASSNQSQNQGQKQGQQQTANGGNATSQATGGQGGGGGSVNITSNSTGDKLPVNTAYAAGAAPTVTCFKGGGVGIQGMSFGFSANGGKIDENCAILETARAALNSGSRRSFCKLFLIDKYAKKAGVTMEDCMGTQPIPVPPPVIIPEPEPPVPVAAAEPEPVIVKQQPPVGWPTPTFSSTVRNVGSCPAKYWNCVLRLLDKAVLQVQNTQDAKIVLEGPPLTAKAVQYLRTRGIDPSRVTLHFSDIDTVGVETFVVEQ